MDLVSLARLATGLIAQGAVGYLGERGAKTVWEAIAKQLGRGPQDAQQVQKAVETGQVPLGEVEQAVLTVMGANAAMVPELETLVTAVQEGLPVPEVKVPLGSEVPGGTVAMQSQFYLKRQPWEREAHKEIARPGGLVRIKAPRQMGKTSLMVRLLYGNSLPQGKAMRLSLQEIERERFNSLEALCYQVCALVADMAEEELGLEVLPLDPYWEANLKRLGIKKTCTNYIKKAILAPLPGPLVLGLDEVERLFEFQEVAAEFLGMLRFWFEDGKTKAVWGKLRLVLIHSTEVYVAMDRNQSPLNVGLAVDLAHFTGVEVLELAGRHGLGWGDEEVQVLMDVVGGHPFLVRLGLYWIAEGHVSLRELVNEAATDDGIFGSHLRRYYGEVEAFPELLAVMRRLVQVDELEVERVLGWRLQGLGVVRMQGNRVWWRLGLYRRYFQQRLL